MCKVDLGLCNQIKACDLNAVSVHPTTISYIFCLWGATLLLSCHGIRKKSEKMSIGSLHF